MTPRTPDDIDYERLARYFAGECSPAEIAAIRAWIAADPVRQRRVEQLQRGWDAASHAESRGDVEQGWAALSARLDEAVGPESRPPRPALVLRPPPSTLAHRPWLIARRAAAILAAVALGGAAAWEFGRMGGAERRVAAQDAVIRVVATKPGQQANIYLSDGTHIILGVVSTLRFPTAFGASRDVTLDGEAFFEVAHEPARAFRVHTRYGIARDLGTKFDVRAYRNLPGATITVTEGSVVITPPVASGRLRPVPPPNDSPAVRAPDSLIVVAAEVGTASSEGVLTVTRDSALDKRLAWMSGRLVFDQMPVSEAIDQINRWFGSDVRVGDARLAELRLTASLGDEPLERAITIVAGALDARVERRGSTFTLYPKRPGR